MLELSQKRRGFMFVLSSPSGGGKTTMSRLLLERDNNLMLSISATTRSMRPGEADGVDYFFLKKEEFMEKASAKEFLEYEEVFGNYYGTPRKKAEEALDAGKDVLFDIDWQGTRRLTLKAREDIASIFILPPSMAELERRLRTRGTDSEEVITHRMRRAYHEISHWDEYDYVIVNRNLEESLEKIHHILKAERLRRVRQHSLSHFVDDLLSQRQV